MSVGDDIKMLREAVRDAPAFVVSTDVDGAIRFANRSIIPGKTAEDLAGLSLFELVQPEQRDTTRACVAEVLATGETVGYEARSMRRAPDRYPS